VKNFFLTPERTISRKVTELFMSVLLEIHYDKEEILETYLNEIYLGQDRDARSTESASPRSSTSARRSSTSRSRRAPLLVGMVKGPALYDGAVPQSAARLKSGARRPARDKDRGFATMEEYRRRAPRTWGVNQKAAMAPRPTRLPRSRAPASCGAITTKPTCARKPGVFTTLAPRVQTAAERALERKIAQFDKGKIFGEPGLEGAVVVTDTQSGEVQALVGRAPTCAFRGFKRALDAGRPRGLAPEARDLSHGASPIPRHYTLVTRSTTGFRVEDRGGAGLGTDELRQDLPRPVPLAWRCALLQRRDRAPRHPTSASRKSS